MLFGLKVGKLGSDKMAATNQHLLFMFNRLFVVQNMIVSKYKLHVSIEEVEIILDINVLLLMFFIFICLIAL